MPDKTNIVKVRLFNVMVLCPECDCAMAQMPDRTVYCLNSLCKQYRILYEPPTISLNPVLRSGREKNIKKHTALLRRVIDIYSGGCGRDMSGEDVFIGMSEASIIIPALKDIFAKQAPEATYL